MADLISREAARKKLLGEAVAKYPCSFYVGLFAAADELDRLPAVDAVEVVRCKDCKWRNTLGCPYENFDAAERDDGDYCSDGERGEENG